MYGTDTTYPHLLNENETSAMRVPHAISIRQFSLFAPPIICTNCTILFRVTQYIKVLSSEVTKVIYIPKTGIMSHLNMNVNSYAVPYAAPYNVQVNPNYEDNLSQSEQTKRSNVISGIATQIRNMPTNVREMPTISSCTDAIQENVSDNNLNNS